MNAHASLRTAQPGAFAPTESESASDDTVFRQRSDGAREVLLEATAMTAMASEKSFTSALLSEKTVTLSQTALRELLDKQQQYLHLLDVHHQVEMSAASQIQGEIAKLCNRHGNELGDVQEELQNDADNLGMLGFFNNMSQQRPTTKPMAENERLRLGQISEDSPVGETSRSPASCAPTVQLATAASPMASPKRGKHHPGREAPSEINQEFVRNGSGVCSEVSLHTNLTIVKIPPDETAKKKKNRGFSTIFDSSILMNPKKRKGSSSGRDLSGSRKEGKEGRRCFVTRVCASIVASRRFNIISALAILSNLVVIAMEADQMGKTGEVSQTLTNIDIGFNTWYGIELLTRYGASGRDIFSDPDRRWNFFDLILFLTAVIGTIIHTVDMKAMRIFRLLKIVRTLRVGRLLRHVAELHKMAYSLASSVQTLFWALVLLGAVMFTFSVWLTEGIASSYGNCDPADDELIAGYFGGLGLTTYYLYLSISGGVTWGDLTNVLINCHWSLVWVYLAYISISMFGVLNIVLSVFVESAMQSINRSRELMIQNREQTRNTFVAHMKQIFGEIDTDKSGKLSHAELAVFLLDIENPLHAYFDALDLDSSDVDALFRLLDEDGGGSVDIEEFCFGCLNLKGEAKSYDVKVLQYEILNIQKSLSLFMSQVCTRLHLEGIGKIDPGRFSQRFSQRLKSARPSCLSVRTADTRMPSLVY